MAVRIVTDQTFRAKVLEATSTVVVDFWAEWCLQCPAMLKIVDSVASSALAERVEFYKMDLEEGQATASRYQIRSVPSLMVFRKGEPVAISIGLKPKKEIIRIVERI